MEELFLPTLHTFENGNEFTGSLGRLRFKVTPNVVMRSAKEIDPAQSTMTARYWHGPFCFEKSEIEGEKTFPLTEKGKASLRAWLIANIPG